MSRPERESEAGERPRRGLFLLRLALGLAILVFLGRLLYIHIDEIGTLSWTFEWLHLALGSLVMYLAYCLNVLVWHLLVQSLGERVSFAESFRAWTGSLLARYIPGTVFVLFSRFLSYHVRGTDRKVITVAFLMEMVVTAFAALVVFLALAGFVLPDAGALAYVAILIPFGLLFLHPRVFRPLFNAVLRRLKRDPLERWPGFSILIAQVALVCAAYLIAGAGLLLFIQSFYAVGWDAYLLVTCALAGSAVVNLVVFFIPGGLGVRDSALALFLSTAWPISASVLIALTTRVWMTVIEILLPVSGWCWKTIRRG